jgi:hypothetical protein
MSETKPRKPKVNKDNQTPENAQPEGRKALVEHFDELEATLKGAHAVMETVSGLERRVGPVGSHARGYTHKITKALRHLEALRASLPPAQAAGDMRILYENPGRCFWHMDCSAGRPGRSMMRIERHAPEATLMRCVVCNVGGWYPVGGVGEVRCKVEAAQAAGEPDPQLTGERAKRAWALIRFLDGSAPLDGKWFGEKDGPSGFWWRKYLPSLTSAALSYPAAGEPEALQAAALPVEEQAAFEKWLSETRPSGDCEAVMRSWEESGARADWLEQAATPPKGERTTPVEPGVRPPLDDGFEDWWTQHWVSRVQSPRGFAGSVWTAAARHFRATPTAAAPEVPAAGSAEEMAWLVEIHTLVNIQYLGFPWLPESGLQWTGDPALALRLSRQEDAEQLRRFFIGERGLTGNTAFEKSIKVAEHMWAAPSHPAEQPKGAEQ